MSQTTLPTSASKKPLLKRSFTGHRLRGLPVLPEHPEFPKKVVNDAYIVLITVLQHDEYFQVTRKRIKEESGLSYDRLTAALQYLQAVNIMGKAAWRGNAGLKGWCWRVDLDGKVEHNGTVLHYSQERDEKVQPNARAEMRRRHAGLRGPKTNDRSGRSKKGGRQCRTKMAPSEPDPLYPYNVQPCSEIKKEAPYIPASGENFQSFPGDPQDTPTVQTVPTAQTVPTVEEEIQTTNPVSEAVLELLDSHNCSMPDPAVAPTYYAQAQTVLESDAAWRAAGSPMSQWSQWSQHYRGRIAIEKLQQGPRPKQEAALVWFKANLPGWLLEDCLRPGEVITVQAAHRLVRKLHRGNLTLDNFARYWAAVQTGRYKRLPLVNVVNLLAGLFTIRCEQDAEHATSAAALVHDTFGRNLYRDEKVDAYAGCCGLPDTCQTSEAEADPTTWAPDGLFERLQDWNAETWLRPGVTTRYLWAARVFALEGYTSERNTFVAPRLEKLRAANITKQDVCRWFVESALGRSTYACIEAEFRTCGQDFLDVFGTHECEVRGRIWRLWTCVAAVRESQLKIPYPNMKLSDFCRF